jgi:hypothetical protein
MAYSFYRRPKKEIAMSSLFSLIRNAIVCGAAAVLLLGLGPAVATAQSVRGHGEISNGPGLSPSQISVNAWIDANGVVQGHMTWVGDVANTPPYPPAQGGPAEPFIVQVTFIEFFGNTAFVGGVVVASPDGIGDGQFVEFSFTDNSGTGLPDEIDGTPIIAGNITVDD